jgi:hypothetical protein
MRTLQFVHGKPEYDRVCENARVLLASRNELPVQIFTNVFPNVVLFEPFLAFFQHGEVGQKLVFFQELAQFENRVVVIQKVHSGFRAVFSVGPLQLHEQVAQPFFQFRAHDGRFDPQFVFDERNVFIVFVVAKLF